MPAYADDANPDGSPHAMGTAIFSGIVYLDDYRGGELYFTVRNTPIAPQKGMLLAFTTGF